MQVGIRKGDTRVRSPQEPRTIDGKESATKVNSSDPVNHPLIPMAAVAQATHLTHISFITSNTPPPEGKVCTTGDNYEFNSRVGESLQKGITHNVVRGWFVRSINKSGQRLNGEKRMEQIPDWESLIAERSRPCATMCPTEDAKKNNSIRRIKDWHKRHPNYNAKYYAAHREQKLAENAKWKREHKEKCREYQRNYKLRHKNDPEWHEKRKLWNREYRARKRAEKKAKEQSKEKSS